MTRAALDALEALIAALRTVPGLRVVQGAQGNVDPPTAIVGPPELKFEGFDGGPRIGKYPVHLVVTSDDRAAERALDLLPLVTDAVEEQTDGVVLTAAPGMYPAGSQQLPAYLLTIEVPL